MRGSAAAKVAFGLTILSSGASAVPVGRVYIPPVVAMREMTPSEEDANRVWNLRAALNVAALQCQFSPFLRTVKNYNDVIRHHSAELAKAQATLVKHFVRHDGAKLGQNSFDQYTTRTYSSYSTLDAQLGFCDEAGIVGRQALTVPKGQFGAVALKFLPDIRAALSPQEDPLTRVTYEWATIPVLSNPCIDKRGRPIKKCFDKP